MRQHYPPSLDRFSSQHFHSTFLLEMPIATILDEKTKLTDIKPLIETSVFRSYRAYVEAGFEENIPRAVRSQYDREVKFLAAIPNESTPTRQITRMVRRKENGKQYITFTENWTGTDWVGREISPVTDRLEGVLQLPKVTPKIDEKGQKIGKDLNGSIIKYEYEFSKEMVDKLLEETGTDKESPIYTIRTPNRRDNCNYQQFTETTWIQANDLLMQDGGFEMAYIESLRGGTQAVSINPTKSKKQD